MAKHGLDEYGQPTDVLYERGTKPLGPPKPLPASALAPEMTNRTDSIRSYRAPEDRSDVPKHRERYRSWTPPREVKPEPPSEMIVGMAKPKQSDADAEADKKRLECPFPLVFRPCEPTDYNFVLNAWMRSYRDAQRNMKNEHYFAGQQNLIAELAKRRQMVIGCDGDTPEWIAGFICGIPLEDNRLVVDYIYVKQAYRDRGIARGLLQSLGWLSGQEIVATHKTRGIEGTFPRYNACFNPYFNAIGYSDV
jgi:GNAT superfamily N-acetyltransferase